MSFDPFAFGARRTNTGGAFFVRTPEWLFHVSPRVDSEGRIEINAEDRETYAILLSFDGADGCRPSVARLADRLACDERTVRRRLKRLRRLGLIETIAVGKPGASANQYRFLEPTLRNPPDDVPTPAPESSTPDACVPRTDASPGRMCPPDEPVREPLTDASVDPWQIRPSTPDGSALQVEQREEHLGEQGAEPPRACERTRGGGGDSVPEDPVYDRALGVPPPPEAKSPTPTLPEIRAVLGSFEAAWKRHGGKSLGIDSQLNHQDAIEVWRWAFAERPDDPLSLVREAAEAACSTPSFRRLHSPWRAFVRSPGRNLSPIDPEEPPSWARNRGMRPPSPASAFLPEGTPLEELDEIFGRHSEAAPKPPTTTLLEIHAVLGIFEDVWKRHGGANLGLSHARNHPAAIAVWQWALAERPGDPRSLVLEAAEAACATPSFRVLESPWTTFVGSPGQYLSPVEPEEDHGPAPALTRPRQPVSRGPELRAAPDPVHDDPKRAHAGGTAHG